MPRPSTPDHRAPSAVLLAARLATGAGKHGKVGKGRTRNDRRSRAEVRQDLRRGE